MPKKLRLTDLHRRGRELTVKAPEGEIALWMQKPNGPEMESIYRRANAAKARFFTRAEDEDSDEFQEALSTTQSVDDTEILLGLAYSTDLNRIRARVEAQLETDPDGEWAKDDKLQSLYDAWRGDEENPGLHDTWALDPNAETPEGEEAARVLAELTRFDEAVTAAFEVERDEFFVVHAGDDLTEVRRLGAKVFVGNKAQEVFMREFEKQHIFYATRDFDERDKRYFATVPEIDLLSDEVKATLLECVTGFMLDVVEGKESDVTPDSSPPSEQPETEDASPPSGQQGAAA